MEMMKTYNPKDFEEKIYRFWEEEGFFTPKIEHDRRPFTIVIPPPNVTGQLHMGHALNNTLQDILIRWKRMQGVPTLWLPGTDHAGIATQIKVEAEIAKEGLSKYDLGREAFIERVWQWKHQYGNIIINQLKRLGASCDWTRERFTMDERCSKAVREVFVRLYEKGLIYRGYRIINWCPRCKTALSDIEVEYEDRKSNLWHIKYPIKESDEYIVVATTRPETMLGDTAVAVNPGDVRYKHLIGRTVVLPLMNREIPIIADEYVDPEFGTGAVKVTPAHDPNDYEMGERHGLDKINIMNEDGTLNENAGEYKGLDRYEARKRIVEDLRKLGLLAKVEEHNHSVGQCSRCDTVVEPIISRQWFVKMKPLAQPAIDVVKEGKIKFVPERFSKIYINWMENIRDWCISRQLWWGHRIPAWYCECGEVIVARETPQTCHRCGSSNLEQDPDVLDTWFSSALWPFSTLGWPEQTEDLEYFYPTSVLVTGYDIIPFWVARMIFTALEFMKEIPFEYVLINGIVRDDQGRKMSKSLGNGIDPLDIINNFGADSLRFTLVTGNSPGNDMRFYYDRVEASRNFANKIWNAARFLIMNFDKEKIKEIEDVELTLIDRWILSRLNDIVREVTENLEKFELGIAAQKLYDFVWSEFCDWYIEFSKLRLYSDDEDIRINSQSVLVYVLDKILKLLHPFMPFITEEIWQNLPHKEKSLMISEWPRFSENLQDKVAEKKVLALMDVIKSIRNIKAEVNATSSKPKVLVLTEVEEMRDLIVKGKEYILRLSGSSEVEFIKDRSILPKNSISAVLPDAEIFVPLGELIDIEKELKRLYAEKERIEKEIERAKGKLMNQEFVSKAPEAVVNKEREKLSMYQDMLEKIISRIENLK